MSKVAVTSRNYNEKAYLDSNPDVAEAVKKGDFRSGKTHYNKFGWKENRMMNIENNDSEKMVSDQLSVEEISKDGERVSHLYKNDVYYAHLSIYHFALPFCRGKTVLDAGSGAGYGSAYLAEQGANSVDAFDIEEKAIKFSRYYFPKPNLTYKVMNIEKIAGFPKKHFDVVFTSNALEHVPNVYPFFRSAWELLKPNGTLIVAVPPIVNDHLRKDNLDNPYHLNIWTPRQWFHMLNLFFCKVQPYLHGFDKPGLALDFANSPEKTLVTETDFIFEPISLDDFYRLNTITAIFLAQEPRLENELPPPNKPFSFIDDSFTRPLEVHNTQEPRDVSLITLTKQAWRILCQDGLILMALMRRTKFYLIKKFHR